MRLSFMTSTPLVMSSGKQKGWDRGQWVAHPKGANSMAISVLSFKKGLGCFSHETAAYKLH